MEPKPRRKSRPEFGTTDKSLWGTSKGWKSFDVTDELLMGAEEGGFAGLEVLEDVSLIDSAYLESLNAAAKQQYEAEAAADGSRKGRKTKKKQQSEDKQAPTSGSKRSRTATAADEAAAAVAAAAAVDGDGVDELKARIQQLEAENRALKKPKKGAAGAAVASVTEDTAAATTAEASVDDAEARILKKKLKLQQFKQKQKERKQMMKEKRLKQQQQPGTKNDAKQNRKQGKQQQHKEQGSEAAGNAEAAGSELDMSAWARFCLHPRLESALAAQGFSSPTPIQDAVLLPAIRDRRDVIGAAQTGSGKTLAFGLPILQVLLQEQEFLQQQNAAAAAGGGSGVLAGSRSGKQGGPLRALILCPTRELALQVSEHLQALGKSVGIRVIGLVGGIAPVKQERLLRSCPPVVVATPGRLWDLMRGGHQHLTQLDQLSFFVLDEADRMVQQGHYQELSSILELLPTAERAAAVAAAQAAEEEAQRQLELAAQETKEKIKQNEDSQQEVDSEDVSEDVNDGNEGADVLSEDDASRDLHSSGSEQEEGDRQSADSVGSDGQPKDAAVDHDDEEEEGDQQQQQQQLQQRQDKPRRGRQHHLLQTFVFSATLTLPAHLHKRLRKGGGGSSGAASLESLMDRLYFRERPAIVDLSPSSKLADRVKEGLLQTLDEERDATLYYLLARHPGRALVFVNAVSAVRRVAALLQLLGLPAVALHAQQQQRQRLKALDRFKSHLHGVLVATDVAARGLDIQDVQIVVHYQLPASADTYIHRSGRTARTGGSDGVVLAMVTPQDASRWSALRHALEGQSDPPTFPIDDKVLQLAKQRVALAAKIDAIQRKDRKQHAATSWARSNAEALGIDLSDADDEEDEGLTDLQHSAVKAAAAAGKGKRNKGKALSAAVDSQTAAEKVHAAGQLAGALTGLQRQLAAALAIPLQPSISHKFFTGGMSRPAAAAVAAAAADDQVNGSHAADDAAAAAEGEATGDAAVINKPITVLPAEAMAQTMRLAARLNQSRAGQVAAAGGTGGLQSHKRGKAAVATAAGSTADASKARRKAAAALAAAAGVQGGVLKLAGKGKSAKGKKAGVAGGQQAVIARMLMSRNEIKRQKRQGGMVVVRPGAGVFGRDAAGTSALDVLNMGH